MSKKTTIRLVFKSHRYYLDIFKVIRDQRNILIEATPLVIPGMPIEFATYNKYIVPTIPKNLHWHLTYPFDGNVHQKISFYDEDLKKTINIYEHFKTKSYTVKDNRGNILRKYGALDWFDERVFFHIGGSLGTPLNDFSNSEKCYRLYTPPFHVFNGYTLASIDEIPFEKVKKDHDLIVDITNINSATGNVYVFLHGKNTSVIKTFETENQKVFYKLLTDGSPTIEIGVTLKEQ